MGAAQVSTAAGKPDWGRPPWKIDFHPAGQRLPAELDIAIVGGGFTGLAAAAWLRRLAPEKSVAVFEARSLGAGSSGYTGGVALGETAAGDLPGLGDVLRGYRRILRTFHVNCDLTLPGVYELAHDSGGKHSATNRSPIGWSDGGRLRAVRKVPGGMVDPGKVVSGLARAAEHSGARIFENARVDAIAYETPLRLRVRDREICARQALVATNAMSLELSGLAHRPPRADSPDARLLAGQVWVGPKFTLAVATEPLKAPQLRALALATRRPFYTVDLPYLWGRLLATNGVIFGSGLVHLEDWREFNGLSIGSGEPAELIARLCERVRGLHPVLRDVKFTHRWGGPMMIGPGWKPVFRRHPRSADVLVLGAYSGHGVALSVYLGSWAAEVLLGRKKLPNWSTG
jgi:glycine/D-amino acid oxidase-like deaminating enzyme